MSDPLQSGLGGSTMLPPTAVTANPSKVGVKEIAITASNEIANAAYFFITYSLKILKFVHF
jgi:hypothetical protein